MKFMKLSLGVIIGFYSLISLAEETGLRFSIGPLYRNFDDVEFDVPAFRNAGNVRDPAGPYGIQNYPATAQPGGNADIPNIPVDYIQSGENEDNIDTGSQWGPMLGMELDIVDNVEYVISFVSNFQFFSVQAESNGGTNARHYFVDYVFIGPDHQLSIPDPLDQGFPGLSQGTSASVDSDFDMELYVFDAGLKISVANLDPLRVGLAAGPTLSIGDVDTRQQQTATFTPFDSNTPETISESRNKSDVDFIIGLYAALEAAYRLSETFSLAVGVRYDFNTVEVGTSLAEMDLDTVGGYARLVLDF